VLMWSPDKNVVSTKETVGRRVFEVNPFFERNGKQHVKVSIFYETRPDEEGMSFDRLGIKDTHRVEVVGFLTPLARDEAANRRPPRPFSGWMGIKVSSLQDLGIRPDPVMEEPKNPYHALLPLDRFRDKIHADNLAYRLALAAEDIGLIQPAEENTEQTTESRSGLSIIVANMWLHLRSLVLKALGRGGESEE
jgi:hypothetical protein